MNKFNIGFVSCFTCSQTDSSMDKFNLDFSLWHAPRTSGVESSRSLCVTCRTSWRNPEIISILLLEAHPGGRSVPRKPCRSDVKQLMERFNIGLSFVARRLTVCNVKDSFPGRTITFTLLHQSASTSMRIEGAIFSALGTLVCEYCS